MRRYEEHATLLHDLSPFIRSNREDLNRVMKCASALRLPTGTTRAGPAVPVGTTVPVVSSIPIPQLSELTSRIERLEKAPTDAPDQHREALKNEIEEFDIINPNEKARKSKSYRRRSGRGERGRTRRKGKSRNDPDDSSSDETTPSRGDQSDVESLLSLHDGIRRNGTRHPGLRELKPKDPQFNELVSYRFYRLRNHDQSRNGRETGKIKDHINRLELTMRDLTFDGTDPFSF